MVKYFLTIILFFLTTYTFAGPNTAILHTASWCHYCKDAKVIINKLITEGYDVEIIDNQQLRREQGVRSLPTLVIKKNDIITAKYVGLLSETQYRNLIPKKMVVKAETKNNIFFYIRLRHPQREAFIKTIKEYVDTDTRVTVVSVPGPTFIVINGSTYFGIKTVKELEEILTIALLKD